MGFGIGFGEIVLILLVAVIILGPQKLPEFARTMGKTLRTLRKATTDLTNTVTKELEITEAERTHTPPQEASRAENEQAPSPPVTAGSPGLDNQPTTPGGASSAK